MPFNSSNPLWMPPIRLGFTACQQRAVIVVIRFTDIASLLWD
ncbi:hypothetical protein ACNKHL_23600 [Shigella flexneri]